MRALLTFLALGLAAGLFFGCASSQSSRPRADSPEIIEQVRSRVLHQCPTLDAASRETIQTSAPKIWFVGLPFGGDYTFQWMITSNRTVELQSANGLEHLSECSVFIREPAPASHY